MFNTGFTAAGILYLANAMNMFVKISKSFAFLQCQRSSNKLAMNSI